MEIAVNYCLLDSQENLTVNMPSLKIYPPSQLPDRGVTETQFNIWQEELEVYLMQEKDYAVFLQDGSYATWESLESNKDRIPALKAEDMLEADAAANRSQTQADAANEECLRNVRKNLRLSKKSTKSNGSWTSFRK